jgi:hypothetical protein
MKVYVVYRYAQPKKGKKGASEARILGIYNEKELAHAHFFNVWRKQGLHSNHFGTVLTFSLRGDLRKTLGRLATEFCNYD